MQTAEAPLLLILALLIIIFIYRRRWRQALTNLSRSRAALLRLYGSYVEVSNSRSNGTEAEEGDSEEVPESSER